MKIIYTQHASLVVAERDIKMKWIKRVLEKPELVQAHKTDPTLKVGFRRIPEFGNRVLRVVFRKRSDNFEIITVFFDRSMKGKL